MNDHRKPTWANQLWHARKLLAEKGSLALENRTAPGAHLSAKRCSLTPSLFDQRTDRETKTGIADLFGRLFK